MKNRFGQMRKIYKSPGPRTKIVLTASIRNNFKLIRELGQICGVRENQEKPLKSDRWGRLSMLVTIAAVQPGTGITIRLTALGAMC